MIKRFLVGSFALFLTLILGAQNSDEYQLLWEITGPDVKSPSYLYGTIHVKDARVFNFIDSVYVGIDQTEAFALELDPDSMMVFLLQYLNTEIEKHLGGGEGEEESNGNSIRDLLTDEEYNELNQRVFQEVGLQLNQFEGKSPAVLRRMLGEGLTNHEQKKTFVDAYLYELARGQQKEILGVEEIADQMGVLDDLQDKWSREELLALINRGEGALQMEDLIQLYTKGNINEMYRLLNSSESFDEVFIRRNIKMASEISRMVKRKSTFIAVGAGHLAGDGGLIDLLRKDGLSLRQVGATWSDKAYKWKKKPVKQAWKKYVAPDHGFSVEFPTVAYPMPIAQSGVTMHFSLNLSDGRFLTVMDFRIPVADATITPGMRDMLYEQAYKSFMMQDPSASGKIKKVKYDDIEGREFTMTSDEIRIRAQMFLRGSTLYLPMAAEPLATKKKEGKQFFKSLQLYDVQPPEWKRHRSIDGAFTLDFPGNPNIKVHRSNAQNGETLFKVNNFSGQKFTFRYFDNIYSYSANKDTSILRDFLDLVAGQAGSEDYEVTYLDLDEIPALRLDMKSSSGKIKSTSVVTLRGNRIFIMITELPTGSKDTKDTERWVNSFKYTPFDEIRWTDYTDSVNGFKVKMPNPEVATSSATTRWDENMGWWGRNTSYEADAYTNALETGAYYGVRTQRYDKYYSAKDTASWHDDFMVQHVSESDSMLFEKRGRDGSGEYIERHYGHHESSRMSVFRSYFRGPEIVSLAMHGSVEEIEKGMHNPFFESFKLDRKESDYSIFENHDKELIAALGSTDTIERLHAMAALDTYQFTAGCEYELEELLLSDIPADSAEREHVRNRIANQLGNGEADFVLPLVRKVYKVTNDQELRHNLLNTLAGLNTTESIKTLVTFLNDDPPVEVEHHSIWQITSAVDDSVKLWVPFLDDIGRLLRNPDYAMVPLNVFTTMLMVDSTLAAPISKWSDQMLSFYEKEVSKASKSVRPMEMSFNPYLLWRVLGICDPGKYRRAMATTFESGNYGFTREALQFAVDMESNLDFNSELVSSISKYPEFRHNLYQLLCVADTSLIKGAVFSFDSVIYSHSLSVNKIYFESADSISVTNAEQWNLDEQPDSMYVMSDVLVHYFDGPIEYKSLMGPFVDGPRIQTELAKHRVIPMNNDVGSPEEAFQLLYSRLKSGVTDYGDFFINDDWETIEEVETIDD